MITISAIVITDMILDHVKALVDRCKRQREIHALNKAIAELQSRMESRAKQHGF